MTFLNRLSLKWRLLLVISLPLIAIAGLTAYALVLFSDINRGVSSIYNDRVVPLQDLKTISDDYAVLVIDAINKANAGLMTPSEAASAMRKSEAEVQDSWRKYTATKLTEREQQLVSEAEQLFSPAHAAIQDAIDTLSGFSGSAKGRLDALDGPLYEVIDPVTEKIGELVALQQSEAAKERTRVGELYQTSRVVYLAIAVVVSLLSVVVSVLIVRSITGPIYAMRSTMQRLTEHKDLSQRMTVEGNDELADLASALNGMLSEFDSVITRLSSVAEEVATASEELSAVNATASRNVQEQSSQTDQVATAMNQMSAASADVARNAEESQSAAREAKELGVQGRVRGEQGRESLHRLSEEIQRVAQQISSLESKSVDIRRVTAVIDEIAEQTNLLALNAAIEAARAGEHGRGFSVVADEVRSLAQRTQTSTAEITEVIEGLVQESKQTAAVMQSGLEKVEDNRTLSEQVAETINEIVDAIDQIARMGEQIASAAEEQSVAAEQVNSNLTHIVDLSSQTLSGAQQSSAASEELARLAADMKDRVSSFRTSAR